MTLEVVCVNDRVQKVLKIKEEFSNGKILLIHDILKKDIKDCTSVIKENSKYNIIEMDYRNIEEVYNNLKEFNHNTIIITNKTYDELDKFKKDCFLLNFDRITNCNNYLFLANFEEYNFDDLDKENKDKSYEGIMWNNRTHINLGDYVYVYYNNVPDRINRILLKAKVIDDGYHFGDDNSKCLYDGDKQAIRIKCVSVFDDKNDRFKFGKNNLEKYGLKFNNFNSKQKITNNELIKDLEDYIEKNKSTLSEFKSGFKSSCAFKDYDFKDRRYNHITFEKENGFLYYEIHHLIEQHNVRSKDMNINEEVVYNPINEFGLCPNCHSRIHNGRIEDRKKMVKYLYNKHSKDIDSLLDKIPREVFKDIPNVSNKNLFWLLSQYVKPENINESDLIIK